MKFYQTRFTINKDQSIYIDRLVFEDKQKPEGERQYRGGRSEVVRKMIKNHQLSQSDKAE